MLLSWVHIAGQALFKAGDCLILILLSHTKSLEHSIVTGFFVIRFRVLYVTDDRIVDS